VQDKACLSRAACLVHPNVYAIQFGFIMSYLCYIYVLVVVIITITSCPASFHILPHAVCLASHPGSAATKGPIQPFSVPCALGMMSMLGMTGPLEMLACLNITAMSQLVLEVHTARFDYTVLSIGN